MSAIESIVMGLWILTNLMMLWALRQQQVLNNIYSARITNLFNFVMRRNEETYALRVEGEGEK